MQKCQLQSISHCKATICFTLFKTLKRNFFILPLYSAVLRQKANFYFSVVAVVYFYQRTGAPHAVCWSKSIFNVKTTFWYNISDILVGGWPKCTAKTIPVNSDLLFLKMIWSKPLNCQNNLLKGSKNGKYFFGIFIGNPARTWSHHK